MAHTRPWLHVIGGGLTILLCGLVGCGKKSSPATSPAVAAYATIVSATYDDNPAAIDTPTPEPSPTSTTPPIVTLAPPPTESLPAAPEQSATAYDESILIARMTDEINRDRSAAGLDPVAWDGIAARAGELHAIDMITRGFFSHWNPDGLGPDHRYSAAGGIHIVRENLYTFSSRFSDGSGAPIDNWLEVIDRAQSELMNSSGHRDNILDPAHTHVGIGMSYDPATGQFVLAQEFTNQHVQLGSPLPREARPGDDIRVAGTFGPAVVGGTILDLAYEPSPAPLSRAKLATRNTYMSAAQTLGAARSVGLSFDETLTLPSTPGYYHVRLFADLANGQTIVLDQIIVIQ